MRSDPRTLQEMLRAAAESKGTQPLYKFLSSGVVDGPIESLSPHDLDQDAARYAATFGELINRCSPQNTDFPSRVGIVCEDPLEFARAFFGALYAGAVPVPLDPLPPGRAAIRIEVLQSILRDAQPSILFTDVSDTSVLSAAARVAPDVQVVNPAAVEASASEPCQIPIDPDTPAFLQYTSGTTAMPRGVVIRHCNVMANLRSIVRVLQPPRCPVGVSWLPPTHDMGLVGNLLLAPYTQGELVLMSARAFVESPVQWLRAISHFRAWGSCAPNFAFSLCNRAIRKRDAEELDLSSLEALLCGAEPIRSETLERFLHRFGPQGLRREAVRPSYGLAEATLFVSVMSSGPDVNVAKSFAQDFDTTDLATGRLTPSSGTGARRVVSCGKVQPDVDVKIVDSGTGFRMPDGQIGEIWVAGESVCSGYFGDEERRRPRLRGDGDDRYVSTGDLGGFWEDQLFITGRTKEQVIVYGKNYDAHALECIAARAHPELRPELIAILSDPSASDRIIVLVEAPPGMESSVFAPIRRKIFALLGEWGVRPANIVFAATKSIVRTPSGKVRRSATWDQLHKGAIQALPETLNDESCSDAYPHFPDEALAQRLLHDVRLAARMGERDRISWTTRLSELGIDSLGLIQLSTSLRDAVNREVPMELFDRDPTLEEIRIQLQAGVPATAFVEHGNRSVPPAVIDLTSRQELRSAKFDDVFTPARLFAAATGRSPESLESFYRPFADWKGTHASLGGQRVLILSSFDYLGLAVDTRVREAAARASEQLGTTRSGARIHVGTSPELLSLEGKIARFFRREDALICSTGYQAMAGLISALMNPGNTLVVDEDIHASILDGAAISRCRQMRFRHNDPDDLARVLEHAGPAMVMIEGLYSNGGDLPPLPEISKICRRFGARLAIDEAHSLGTLGNSGGGSEEHFGVPQAADLLAGTFSKSLCSVGGWIAGERSVIDYIRYFGRSILFSAAISPSSLAAASAAFDILTSETNRIEMLSSNAKLFRQRLSAHGVPFEGHDGPIVRIPMESEETCLAFAGDLLTQRIFVQPVLYPSVHPDKPMVRMCVSAGHDPCELTDSVSVIASVYRRHCPAENMQATR